MRTSKRIFQEVYIAHNGHCHYCGVKVEIKGYGDTQGTIDHYIPRSKGGENTFSNMVLSCKGCNDKKADTMPSKPLSRKNVTLPTTRKQLKEKFYCIYYEDNIK